MMSVRFGIPLAVQGAIRPGRALTWIRQDNDKKTMTPEDLTSATITGVMRSHATGLLQNIVGTLSVSDGPAGQFDWQFATEDVAEVGRFDVQFTADYGGGVTPARSFHELFEVAQNLAANVNIGSDILLSGAVVGSATVTANMDIV